MFVKAASMSACGLSGREIPQMSRKAASSMEALTAASDKFRQNKSILVLDP